MRILADENCDRMLVMSLRDAGHDVDQVVAGRRGDPDLDVFHLARAQQRVLLTDDLDFGKIAEVESRHPPSIVLARLYPMGRVVRVNRVVEVLGTLGEAVLGHLVVIEPSQVRMRALGGFEGEE